MTLSGIGSPRLPIWSLLHDMRDNVKALIVELVLRGALLRNTSMCDKDARAISPRIYYSMRRLVIVQVQPCLYLFNEMVGHTVYNTLILIEVRVFVLVYLLEIQPIS